MAATVAELTPAELRAMIEEIVRDELLDAVSDPDEGLELRPEVRAQLEAQRERVRQGDFGIPWADISRPASD